LFAAFRHRNGYPFSQWFCSSLKKNIYTSTGGGNLFRVNVRFEGKNAKIRDITLETISIFVFSKSI